MTNAGSLETSLIEGQSLIAFNARTMPLRQVVDSFVVPDAFDRLRRPVNTLLSGPRGSGKTTLMKMLQPMALELWDDPRAQQISDEIPYTGVFIPTDRSWKRQLEPVIGADNPFAPELQLVSNAAFTMHVLRETFRAMEFRFGPASAGRVRRPRVTADDRALRRLVANLGRVAQVESFEPSFGGLIDALSIRMTELSALRNAFRDGRSFPVPDWARVDCLSATETAIGLFNRTVADEDHQWALLFDEMELAPSDLVERLLDAMRGQPQNMLLKLSLSPVQPELAVLHLPHAGVHGQDFELIQLNYARQREALKFGKDMFLAQARRRGYDISAPVDLLGASLFSSIDEGAGGQDYDQLSPRRRSPYAKGSALWKRYSALAEVDRSFREWLEKNDVDLDGLDALDPISRASKLRKVRNLVVVRQFYRSAEARRRSRKSYDLYTGADTILAFCDGNARLLTALIGQLLSQAVPRSAGQASVSRPMQGHAIDSTIRRFFALVYSAESAPTVGGGSATLVDLVNRIGESLAVGVVEDPFSDNVPLTFTVDKRVPSATIRLLHVGINAGAFVHIPKRPDYRVPLDLAGEQFRLTYVLAPYYGLPVRLGPSTSLSGLLQRGRRMPGRHSSSARPVPDRSQQAIPFSSVIEPEHGRGGR